MLELILKDGHFYKSEEDGKERKIKGEKIKCIQTIVVNTSINDATYSLDKEIDAANHVLKLHANACFVSDPIRTAEEKYNYYPVLFLDVPKKYLK
jgi:hypothetical protein